MRFNRKFRQNARKNQLLLFQEKYDIPQTGSVGPFTLSKLNNLFNFPIPKQRKIFPINGKKDLYYGLTGSEDVRALQNALLYRRHALNNGPISGNFYGIEPAGRLLNFRKNIILIPFRIPVMSVLLPARL